MPNIHFGTDGWRAIIGEDFTPENLEIVARASAKSFKEKYGLGKIYVGHDCRLDAHKYAELTARIVSEYGFDVVLTQDYCPTPTLCWSVAHDDAAVGGVMLTSSHNASEYLGVKLRMKDGGASPSDFTERVEELFNCVDDCAKDAGSLVVSDLMTPYLESLKGMVDVDAIRAAKLHIALDPLFGASRLYLSGLLEDMGVKVTQIHETEDPSFQGLHPEPISPWIDEGLELAKKSKCDALFINDGDADRIAAGDCDGRYVNPHRIIMLVTKHLFDTGKRGRVVSTITASALLGRLCKKLGLELTSTPVGFKWIYAEMQKSDVMVGGEESGGIGIPSHVMERDGLLMALLLCETMAKTGKDIKTLVDDLLAELGHMEFERRGLTVTDSQMQKFRNDIIPNYIPDEVCGLKVVGKDSRDGIKLLLERDCWVMMRPSGTEPLVRIYAEAENFTQVNELLTWAEKIVTE